LRHRGPLAARPSARQPPPVGPNESQTQTADGSCPPASLPAARPHRGRLHVAQATLQPPPRQWTPAAALPAPERRLSARDRDREKETLWRAELRAANSKQQTANSEQRRTDSICSSQSQVGARLARCSLAEIQRRKQAPTFPHSPLSDTAESPLQPRISFISFTNLAQFTSAAHSEGRAIHFCRFRWAANCKGRFGPLELAGAGPVGAAGGRFSGSRRPTGRPFTASIHWAASCATGGQNGGQRWRIWRPKWTHFEAKVEARGARLGAQSGPGKQRAQCAMGVQVSHTVCHRAANAAISAEKPIAKHREKRTETRTEKRALQHAARITRAPKQYLLRPLAVDVELHGTALLVDSAGQRRAPVDERQNEWRIGGGSGAGNEMGMEAASLLAAKGGSSHRWELPSGGH